MESLRATFEVVTPVFCAGANQKGPSAIRPMSMRGALRFWYRALDGDFRENEPKHFGDAAGDANTASPITLRVGEVRLQANRNLRQEYGSKPPHYFGYFLYAGDNERQAIVPDATPEKNRFVVQLDARWPGDLDRTRRAWAAALWLFGHLGGLGARSRRAFGTLALVDWPQSWEGIALPRPAHGAATPQEWIDRFTHGLRMVREWFPRGATPGHGHQAIDERFSIFLLPQGSATNEQAINDAASVLSSLRSMCPDKGLDWHGELSALGLPRSFSNPQEQARPQGTGDRSASRLHIRVVRIGNSFHPLFAYLRAPLVPEGATVVISGPNQRSADPGTPNKRSVAPGTEALWALLDVLMERNAIEARMPR